MPSYADLLESAEFLAALQSQGSLSALARQRNEGQGTLSKRLRGYERRLGQRLVLRGGRRIVLTEVGQRLVRVLRDTRPLLASLEAALADALVSDSARQTLRLGMGDSLTQSGLFRAFARGLASGPSPLSLELHLGNATLLEDLVLNRSLDAALLFIPSHWPALVYRAFFKERVFFVTHASNAVEHRAGKIEARALVQKLGVVVPTLRIDRHRRYLDDIFGPHFEGRFPIVASTDGILPAHALLSAGVGAGFLQAHLIGDPPDPACWHAFEGWQREHTCHLVYEAELRADPTLRRKLACIERARDTSGPAPLQPGQP